MTPNKLHKHHESFGKQSRHNNELALTQSVNELKSESLSDC